MKKKNIIFWVSTGLFSLMMLFSAYMYMTSSEIKASFEYLGFPDYFRVELAVAKFLGAIVLLLPMLPKLLRQFAYAGFTINLVSACIAHLSKGDPFQVWIMPLVFLGVLIVSFIYDNELETVR